MLEFASFHVELIPDKNNTARDPEMHLGVFWFILVFFYLVLQNSEQSWIITTVLPTVCLYHTHFLKETALAPGAEAHVCPTETPSGRGPCPN